MAILCSAIQEKFSHVNLSIGKVLVFWENEVNDIVIGAPVRCVTWSSAALWMQNKYVVMLYEEGLQLHIS